MDIIKSIILGIVQGLTEFLPISSSAHLIFIPKLLHWDYSGKTFDVALHLGTFLGVLFFYRVEAIMILKNFFRSFANLKDISANFELRLPWLIIISSFPAVIFALLFEKKIEEVFSQVLPIAIFLIFFGIILGIAEAKGRKDIEIDKMTIWNAIVIGMAQAFALFPGVSRSGITMTAGLFTGLKKESSANYSFLISLPVIGGAALYSCLKFVKDPQELALWPMFVAGIISSAISGFFVIRFLLNYLKEGSFRIFVYYRVILGFILIILYFISLKG